MNRIVSRKRELDRSDLISYQGFNPVGSIFTTHPNSKVTSPFVVPVNRTATESIETLGSQMFVYFNPTSLTKVAAGVIQMDNAGSVISHSTINYNLDFSKSSTKASVVSFANTIQCTTVSATNASIAGTATSAVLTVPLSEFIATIATGNGITTLTPNFLPLKTSDLLQANQTEGYIARGVPISVGTASMAMFPNDWFTDINEEVPIFGTNLLESSTGLDIFDNTDSCKSVLSAVIAEQLPANFTNGQIVVLEGPTFPVTVGNGTVLNVTVDQTVSIGTATSTSIGLVSVIFNVYTIDGDLVGASNVRAVNGMISINNANTQQVITGTTQFIMSGVAYSQNAYFVQTSVQYEFRTTNTITSNGSTRLRVYKDEAARKHYGEGPGTIISYLTGMQTGQSITFNISQMCIQEPTVALQVTQTTGRMVYDGNLNQAITTISRNNDKFGIKTVMPMDMFPDNVYYFQQMLKIVTCEYALNEEIDGTVRSKVKAIKNTTRYLENECDGEIHEASAKSWFRKAGKWLKDNLEDDLVKPAVKPFVNLAKKYGKIGKNVLLDTANRLANTADTALESFVPVGSVNYASNLPLPKSLDYISKYSGRQYRAMDRRIGSTIVKCSEEYYQKFPKEDIVFPETNEYVFEIPISSCTFFPVITQDESYVGPFDHLIGGCLMACVRAKEIPGHESKMHANRMWNFKSKDNGWTPENDYVAMKVLSSKRGKVVVAYTANPIEDRSWNLAAWANDHNMGGFMIAYSGALSSGQIGALPPDVCGLKKAVCNRNNVILVANSDLADVSVEAVCHMYRKLLYRGDRVVYKAMDVTKKSKDYWRELKENCLNYLKEAYVGDFSPDGKLRELNIDGVSYYTLDYGAYNAAGKSSAQLCAHPFGKEEPGIILYNGENGVQVYPYHYVCDYDETDSIKKIFFVKVVDNDPRFDDANSLCLQLTFQYVSPSQIAFKVYEGRILNCVYSAMEKNLAATINFAKFSEAPPAVKKKVKKFYKEVEKTDKLPSTGSYNTDKKVKEAKAKAKSKPKNSPEVKHFRKIRNINRELNAVLGSSSEFYWKNLQFGTIFDYNSYCEQQDVYWKLTSNNNYTKPSTEEEFKSCFGFLKYLLNGPLFWVNQDYCCIPWKSLLAAKAQYIATLMADKKDLFGARDAYYVSILNVNEVIKAGLAALDAVERTIHKPDEEVEKNKELRALLVD